MPTIAQVTDEILVLAASYDGSSMDADRLAEVLCTKADKTELEAARQQLLERIYSRSDDYAATRALQLVNRALARAGWHDPYNWKHRRKP
jgi:serine protease inhibitor